MVNAVDYEELSYKEVRYSAKEVRDKLSLSESTLRRWCIELEGAGYVFHRVDRSKNGSGEKVTSQRVFYETNIAALKVLKDMIANNNDINLAEAARRVAEMDFSHVKGLRVTIESDDEPRTPSVQHRTGSANNFDPQEFIEAVKKYTALAVQQEIEPLQREIQELKKELDTYRNQLPAPESHESKLNNALDANELIRRVERKLDAEARDAWKAKPLAERVKQRGALANMLLGQEEDIIKRDDFIKNYINKRLESELIALRK